MLLCMRLQGGRYFLEKGNFNMKKLALFILVVVSQLSTHALASNEVIGREVLRQKLGLQAYGSPAHLKDVKVAVLDNGFDGYVPDKGLLPQSAELVNLTKIGAAPTTHGLGMAQIIWALTGKGPDGPKFYLINTNGFSNLKAAVQFVIDNKIEIVLYSQVWPFGGNFDGTGFINALVTQAVQSGSIWINAAGNNGGMVYNGVVEKQKDVRTQLLAFNGRDHLRFENKFDENQVTVTLSWTDFQESENYNTAKDLDLFVYDQSGKLVSSSELIQRGEAPANGDTKLSSHARENIAVQLDRGSYQIKIKVNSNNFTQTDRFRVLLKAEKEIIFTDHTKGGEIMPPADNPLAITVGENIDPSATGPTADGRTKPDILIADSRITFTNGGQYNGSSTAAAMLAGAVSVMKAQEAGFQASKLQSYVNRLREPGVSNTDLSLPAVNPIDPTLLRLIPPGGKLMIHKLNRHYVILTPEDPFELSGPKSAGITQVMPDDILVYEPHSARWYVIPKSLDHKVQMPLIEFRMGTPGTGIWRTPTPTELRAMIG